MPCVVILLRDPNSVAAAVKKIATVPYLFSGREEHELRWDYAELYVLCSSTTKPLERILTELEGEMVELPNLSCEEAAEIIKKNGTGALKPKPSMKTLQFKGIPA